MLARSYLWRMRLWKTISSWCCWLVLRAAEKPPQPIICAKELMCRLMGEGHYVYCLSMDDWYMSADRYTMPVDEEGQPDYESRIAWMFPV